MSIVPGTVYCLYLSVAHGGDVGALESERSVSLNAGSRTHLRIAHCIPVYRGVMGKRRGEREREQEISPCV